MAVVITMKFPGVSEEQYEGAVGHLEFTESSPFPMGLLVHVAGPMQDGWQVIDVWESQQDFDRFHESQLQHAVAANDWALGGPDSVWEVHSIFAKQVWEHGADG